MPIMALAADGGGVGGMVTSAGEVLTSALGIITANPILAVPIGAALLGVGFALFRKARNSAGAN